MVFLSYSHDDQPAARRIAEALRSSGIEVWLDASELRGGDAWDRNIRLQIKSCSLFVPIISGRTQQRSEGYFRFEWRLAIERMRHMADGVSFLAPIAVDETPEAEAVVPEEFLRVQWMRLPSGHPTPAFVEQIQRMLAGAVGRMGDAAARAGEARGRAGGVTEEVGESAQGAGERVGRSPEKSVAVLAFANLSRDPENEYFSDGISEELLNLLGRIPGIRVAGRTSAFYFKGRNATIREIAATLSVAHIVEGSVRKAGSRVRISAKLINAADGFQMWSDSFDRELEDIFALQDEIAALIAHSLQLKLVDAGRPARVVNREAHRLLLEGRHFFGLRTAAGFARAQQLFEAATRADPSFADAHAGLASVWMMGTWYESLRDLTASPTLMQRAAAEAHKAVELDRSLPEAHAALGLFAYLTRRCPDAERCFLEALRLNPNFATVYHWYAHVLSVQGHLDRALSKFERAFELDPLERRSMLIIYASQLNFARQYATALAMSDRASELIGPDEDLYAALCGPRAFALWSLGRTVEAVDAARLVRRDVMSWYSTPRWWADEEALFVLRSAGHIEEAREQYTRLQTQLPPAGPAHGPLLHALGRFEDALPYLEQCPQTSFFRLYYHEIWDDVREDPRFQQLLTRLGCEAEYRFARQTLARMLQPTAGANTMPATS